MIKPWETEEEIAVKPKFKKFQKVRLVSFENECGLNSNMRREKMGNIGEIMEIRIVDEYENGPGNIRYNVQFPTSGLWWWTEECLEVI